MKEIYLIESKRYAGVYYGCFTDRTLADKYCVVFSELDCRVKAVHCLDEDKDLDLSDIVLKYEYKLLFGRRGKEWVLNSDVACTPYQAYSLRNDTIEGMFFENSKFDCIVFYVNLPDRNEGNAVKLAEGLLHIFLELCDNKPNSAAIVQMNKVLKEAREAQVSMGE